MASIVPIYKGSGGRSEPSNYRPISILSIIGKIFECILNKQLLSYLEINEFLSDAQYGFRQSRSTGDLLSLLTGHIHKALDQKGKAFMVALDISKAFDKIWHRGLLHKMQSYGISDPFLSLIRNFLSNRHLKVVLDGQSSSTFSINAGVPQGSVLAPHFFLFVLMILPMLSSPSFSCTLTTQPFFAVHLTIVTFPAEVSVVPWKTTYHMSLVGAVDGWSHLMAKRHN